MSDHQTRALWMHLPTFLILAQLSVCAAAELVPMTPSGKRTVSCGEIPDGDTNIAAIVELQFLKHVGEMQVAPAFLPSVAIEPEYVVTAESLRELDALRAARSFEVAGGIRLAGSASRHGARGIRFSAVPENYDGKGWNLMILGAKYKIRVSKPRKATAWLTIPDSLEAGKRYVVQWVLPEDADTKAKGSDQAAIVGRIGPDLLEKRTAAMTVIYKDPTTRQESDAAVSKNGQFVLPPGRLGGQLILYDQFEGSAGAVCVLDAVTTSSVDLPNDADELYNSADFVLGTLRIPQGFVPSRGELYVGVYSDAESDTPLVFHRLSSDQLLNTTSPRGRPRNDQDASYAVVFAFIPGVYDARLYQYGRKTGAVPMAGYIDPQRELMSSTEIRLAKDGKNQIYSFPTMK